MSSEFNEKNYSLKMDKTIQSFKKEISTLRTGRANSSMLDMIKVDVYGQMMPINQLATISVPEARLITVQVWDKGNVNLIDSAIQKSDLGINPTVAGEVIRIIMPPLTEESRRDLTKKAKNEAENARIAIRNVRRDCITSMKNLEKGGELTEDDISDSEKDIQEITDNFSKQIDDTLESKEKDLLTI